MEDIPIKSGRDSDPPRIAIKLSSYERKGVSQDHDIITRVLESIVPGITQATQIQPLIHSQKPETVAALVARAVQMDPEYKPVDFSAWYQLLIKPSQFKNPSGGKDLDFARQAHVEEFVRRLNDLSEIESSHTLHLPPPPTVNPADDPREKDENYHAAAPLGIDVRYVWGLNLPGGDGAGIGFVDMEQGWNLNHEDLKDAAITLISGVNYVGNGKFNYRGHGTSVLGEVCMVDNVNIGGIGIAPRCTARVISLWQSTAATRSDSDTIIDAVAHMAYGDVLLLEAQAYDSQTGANILHPVEINDDTFEAIRLATAVGITVVEAGANGGVDLDAFTHKTTGKHILNRTKPNEFRDSGAIMVGAASSTVPHNRLGFSSHGSRIDLYAWGENVDTTTTDYTGAVNTKYVPELNIPGFDGTSSASPIITGAAIVVQGIAEANFGFRFAPLELRRILAINGTPSSNPANDLIGVMPNLRAIIDGHFVNMASDVFLRDYVGDNGDPTSGAIATSPDIIVRQSPVTNPQGAFGQASGTENDPSLSQDVLAGRDHAVYVRVANRGASTATDVSVDVYYAIGATLQIPSRWKLIGNTMIPSVPTGRTLVASDEILWSAAAVPGPGHYCFIAVAGSASEPAPVRPNDLLSWYNWLKFVENNNNVAWRNFNVISAPNNRGTKEPHQFSFEIPGAFDVARSFSIETLGSLPRGSSVQLHIPLALARQLRIKLQESQVKEKVAVLPIPAFARYMVGSGMLPPGSIAQCSVLVYVPEATYKQPGTFEFAIRQLYSEIEVGRITWHFGQPTAVKECNCEAACKCAC